MKKLAVLLVLGLSLAACHKTVTAPVPGAINTFDSYAFRVLLDAQAAINSFKASPSAQNPSVKPLLNQAISDYDIAESAYQVWHAAGGTGPTTAISQGIAQVQNDINAISTSVGGK